MHVLLFVDPYDIHRIQLLKKHLAEKSYVSLRTAQDVLHLINTHEHDEVHLACNNNILSGSMLPQPIELLPGDSCLIALSHIGELHSKTKSEIFLQRFYFNGREYSIEKNLQVNLCEFWDQILEAPQVSVCRTGSAPIKRLLLRVKDGRPILGKNKKDVKAC